MNAKRTISLFAMICLAGCGGGGGSGGDGALPPVGQPTLVLTSSNVGEAPRIGIWAVESMLQWATLARNSVMLAEETGLTQFQSRCVNGGPMETDYDVTDADGNGVISAGDRIRVTFRDCREVFTLPLAGDLYIDIDTYSGSRFSDERSMSGRIDATNLRFPTITHRDAIATAPFRFSSDLSLWSDSLEVSGSVDIETTDVTQTGFEKLRNFVFRKVLLFDQARYRITAQGSHDSAYMGGVVEYDGSEALEGYFDELPDAGRFQVIGASGARAAIVPDASPGSQSWNSELDSNGIGTFTFIPTGRRWDSIIRGMLTWYDAAGYRPTPGFSPPGSQFFRLVHVPADNDKLINVNSSLRLQFSREIDPTSLSPTAGARLNELSNDEPTMVTFDVDHRGAAVRLIPQTQYLHGYRYLYPIDFTTPTDFDGREARISNRTFSTPDTLNAAVTASTLHGYPGSRVDLSGSPSTAIDSQITAYQWAHFLGPQVALTNPDSMMAFFDVPSATGAELIGIRLRVTNSVGEYDDQNLYFSAFEDVNALGVWQISSTPGDPLLDGESRFLTTANGDFRVEEAFTNTVWFRHSRPNDYTVENWTLLLAGPNDEDLVVGSYPNAASGYLRAPDQPYIRQYGVGSPCNIDVGQFEVLDISYDANGIVERAAIDFQQHCEGASGSQSGFVRYRSDIPPP